MTIIEISQLGRDKINQLWATAFSILLMEGITINRRLTFNEAEKISALIRKLERLLAGEKYECLADLHSWCSGAEKRIIEDFLQLVTGQMATNLRVQLVSVEEISVVGAIPYDDLPQFFLCCKEIEKSLGEYLDQHPSEKT